MEGHKSQDRKRELISKLLTSSKDNETGYIMRALQVSRSTSSIASLKRARGLCRLS